MRRRVSSPAGGFETNLAERLVAKPLTEALPEMAASDDSPGWVPVSLPFIFQRVFPDQDPEHVVLRADFPRPPQAPEGRTLLLLDEVFYRSTVYLNGRLLGSNEGYFFPHLYDLSDDLKEENRLTIVISCKREENLQRKEQILGVYGHWDLKQPHLQPGGIHGAVRLVGVGPFHIRHLSFHPRRIGSRVVAGSAVVELSSRKGFTGELHLAFEPENFRGKSFRYSWEVCIPPGVSTHRFRLELKGARLWWPYELGDPNLYRLEASLSDGRRSAAAKVQTGLRVIRFDKGGLRVNGRRVFLRGTNLAPVSYYYGDVNRQRAARIVAALKEAHCNVARVHAHVERKVFYDVADREGMLIFQDFSLQWGYDVGVRRQALRQIRRMVRQLHGHPSIFLWCCHNEPFTVPETDPQKVKWWHLPGMILSVFYWNWNKDVLDRQLAKIVKREDQTRGLLRASGLLPTAFHPASDTHLYFGWYQGKLEQIHLALRLFPKILGWFITEYGSQAFPSRQTLKTWFDTEGPVPWEKLSKEHLLQQGIFLGKVPGVSPESFLDELIEKSQRYQCRLIQAYTEAYRLMRYRPCVGVIHFCLNDCSRGITWSVLDEAMRKKRGFEALKRSMNPRLPMLDFQARRRGGQVRLGWRLVVANDLPRALEGARLSVEWLGPKGETLREKIYVLDLPGDGLHFVDEGSDAAELPLTIRLSLTHNGSELARNGYLFTRSKET